MLFFYQLAKFKMIYSIYNKENSTEEPYTNVGLAAQHNDEKKKKVLDLIHSFPHGFVCYLTFKYYLIV